MGLLLSVLVACVGVVELLAFYSNVSRNFVTVSTQTNLPELTKKYLEGLEQHRKNLLSQIPTDDDEQIYVTEEISLDNIRVESCTKVETKSRSSSPRICFFDDKPTTNGSVLSHFDSVTTTSVDESKSSLNHIQTESKSRNETPQNSFITNNDDVAVLTVSLPEETTLVKEELKVLQKPRSKSPSPVPHRFGEQEIASKSLEETISIKEELEVLQKPRSRSLSPVPQRFDEQEIASKGSDETTLVKKELEVFQKPRSKSPSPIPQRFGEQEIFRRSPSPYPSLVLSVPRNSICSELLDNATVSVAEVDEETVSRSPTPEKIHVILESKHNTTEYWTNKVLVVPPTKSRSPSLPDSKKSQSLDSFSSSSKSETRVIKQQSETFSVESVLNRISNISTNEENELEDEIKNYDEQFLDSLDGVKKKKLSRSSSLRRSRKKKALNVSLDSESKDDSLSSSSMQNNDAQTAKTLTEAANVLNTVNREAGGPSVSSTGTSKDSKTAEPEPFWLIFSGEYTKAMNKDWHGQHFCCWQCDESLTGQRYVLRDEHPYCVSCYESVFANACEKCSRTIGIDSKDLSYKDKHWHEACFLCTTCGESLVDRQFGSKGDRIYCGRCYDEQFASRCDGCHEIFRAGTKKMEYKTRQWHEKCFCCCVCKVPIGTQSFIPREQEIYCAKCYEEKFATRCIKCNKVITSGGVTYKNEPWHRECFTCTHCSKSLAGERFTSRDEKPYCAECFGELFAKRCFACNKPITGIGGTKFISFEDRHWHNDCFFCASCRTSLVGRGFITDQDDIICPECAKQKLM